MTFHSRLVRSLALLVPILLGITVAVASARPHAPMSDAQARKPPLRKNPITSRWYSAASPWNTPIPARVAVLPESRRWIDAIRRSVGGINVNRTHWTPTVWFADARTPRYRIRDRTGWTMTVPIPDDFAPSPDTDQMALVIDVGRNREYNLFRPRRDASGRWATTHAGGVLRIFGSGWWNARNGPWIGRASNASYGGGLIRALDARSGNIRHALAVALPKALIGRPIVPATTSDGNARTGGIPMGARLRIDPALDLSSLGLDPAEMMIARAMQRYGMYVVESTGPVMVLYAESTVSIGSDPYPVAWADGLPASLIAGMQFLKPPRPPVYDHRGVFGEPRR